MKLINIEGMEILSAGLPWKHTVSPCCKQAIHLLERNTKVVTWLKPKGAPPQEQIPCILYKGKYFSLSLRMQKAIYRHVRLKKGFKNEETVNGIQTLRIPDLLLKEKMRTQSRFDAMRMHQQQERKMEKRERIKSINTVAAKMKQVIDKMIQRQRDKEVHQHMTVFLYKSQQSEIINAFFLELQKENPTLFENKSSFLALITERYDEFIQAVIASSPPSL